MVKKLLTFVFGVTLLASFASAQTESTIASSDILYWVGEGENEAILVVDFETTALAWGYRFDESDGLTVDDMVNDIMDADPRAQVSYDWNTYDDCIYFVERPQYDLACSGYGFKVNGTLADESDYFEDYDLADGMFVKVSASTDAVWSTTIVPVSIKLMPVDATIDASRIAYWIGEGSNSAVVAFCWSSADTALAWGLRFDGTMSVTQALEAVAAGDTRLTASNSAFSYSDGTTTISFGSASGNVPQFRLDGNGAAGWSSTLSDGSFLKFGESAYGEGYDSLPYYGEYYPMGVVWTTPIHPAFHDATDATISADAIRYWVGEGDNKMIFVVNWADTSLAWGYKFATETVSLTTVMDDIQAADYRFAYTTSGGYLNNITFNDGTNNFSVTPGNYFEQKLNGVSGMGLAETIHNGDFNLWADPAAGVQVGEVDYGEYGIYPIYAYPMEITPVNEPDQTGINSVDNTNVSVFPNPANSVVNITCQPLQSSSEAIVYDLAGRKIFTQSIPAGSDNIQINTSSFANGIYLLHISGDVVKIAIRH